jgi:hypothetical protein
MKFFYTKICVFFLTCLLCLAGGCSSFTRSRSWLAPGEQDIAGTVWVAAVRTDKAGGWSSVENEAAGLLPLLFLEHRMKAVGKEAEADYIAELSLREREFHRGWERRSSLSVELRLWPARSAAGEWETALPLAAARILLQGDESLSSSETLDRLLRQAVKKAVAALPKPQK